MKSFIIAAITSGMFLIWTNCNAQSTKPSPAPDTLKTLPDTLKAAPDNMPVFKPDTSRIKHSMPLSKPPLNMDNMPVVPLNDSTTTKPRGKN